MKGIVKLIVVFTFVAFFFSPDWIHQDLDSLKAIYPNFYWLIYYYDNYLFYLHGIFALYIILSTTNNSLLNNTTNIGTYLSERGLTVKTMAAQLNANVYVRYSFISTTFLRCLSFIYLIAFGSFLWQISLVTKGGIISYDVFYSKMIHHGYSMFLNYPSVFWMNQSDLFIWIIALSGILSSLYNLLFTPKLIFQLIQWFFYLSIISFGRDLYHYPWDTFLSEIGFLAIFLIYFTSNKQLPIILLFAFQLLFFRQWFSMGMTKIVWGAEYWSDYTYMKLFWLNQPSPTPIAHLMYQLPIILQKAATIVCLILELLIPFLMFFGRRGKIIAFVLSTTLSLLIEINGNYGIFNLLTITLGLWCLDNTSLKKSSIDTLTQTESGKTIKHRLFLSTVLIVVVFNLFYVLLQFDKHSNHPLNYTNYYFYDKKNQQESGLGLFSSVGKTISNFRIVSPHGVFKYIPNQRLHLQIQAKQRDSNSWMNVNFKKGKDIKDLSFVAPNMNRIAFYLYYQAYGIELRNLLSINTQSSALPSTMFEILNTIKSGKNSFFSNDNTVTEVRLIHNQLIPDIEKTWKIVPMDTIYFNPIDSMFLPVKSNSKYFLKK